MMKKRKAFDIGSSADAPTPNGRKTRHIGPKGFGRILLLLAFLLFGVPLAVKVLPQVSELATARPEEEAPLDGLYCAQYVIFDRQLKKVVASQGEKDSVKPASLTKLASIGYTLSTDPDLSRTVTIESRPIERMIDLGMSRAGLVAGERLDLSELLYAAFIPSGSDAIMHLPAALNMSEEAFISGMNRFVDKLGLTGSHFSNPVGYDADQLYTTPIDLVRLIDHMLDNQTFYALYTSDSRMMAPTNEHPQGLYLEHTIMKELSKSERRRYPILGGKSGTTRGAGACWSVLVELSGKQYIVLVMGCPIEEEGAVNYRKEDTLKLIRYLERL